LPLDKFTRALTLLLIPMTRLLFKGYKGSFVTGKSVVVGSKPGKISDKVNLPRDSRQGVQFRTRKTLITIIFKLN
jgi:hypothetical protein